MPDDSQDPPRLLTPKEVGKAFRVHPRTITRWTKPGPNGEPPKLSTIRTGGGHRRYLESEVIALLRGEVSDG